MSEEEVALMIANAIHAAKQEVYAEIADSLKSAGEVDHYEWMSISEQAGKAGCAMAGEHIEWLVED